MARGRTARRLLPLLAGLLGMSTATAAPAPPLQSRAEAVLAFLGGSGAIETLFAPGFLADVPRPRIAALPVELAAQFGRPIALERIESPHGLSGTAEIRFEHATVSFDIAVETAAPHRVIGLQVSGAIRAEDSFGAVLDELAGLPGAGSLTLARLEDAGPAAIARHRAEEPLAIGSAFKLVILAELVRAIAAGERRWTDVAPAGPASLASGLLQDWPAGSPLTLHSLATLMIARSDNTASDTLLALLGRERVEAMQAAIGVTRPEANTPFPSTAESFKLKAAGDGALADRWIAADPAARRAMLDGELAALPLGAIEPARLAAGPNRIDRIEWFASTADLVRVMDWLRRAPSPEAQAILAANPGLNRPTARRFAYVGYKGGSETGVVNATLLLRGRAGGWYALAATWNDSASRVDEGRFFALVNRAAALVAE